MDEASGLCTERRTCIENPTLIAAQEEDRRAVHGQIRAEQEMEDAIFAQRRQDEHVWQRRAARRAEREGDVRSDTQSSGGHRDGEGRDGDDADGQTDVAMHDTHATTLMARSTLGCSSSRSESNAPVLRGGLYATN